MKHLKRLSIILLIVFALSVSACNLVSAPAPTPPGPDLAFTAVAQTVAVELTKVAMVTQIVAPTSTSTALVPTATATAVPPTDTPPPPTATSVPPTATEPPVPCDRAAYVEDRSYPDNTEVPAGTTFIKTWRLRNTGSCTWNSSYSLVFDSGDSMGAPASLQLTTGTVPPGGTIDVSVTLRAPDAPKTYQGFWKLRNGAGVVFGVGSAGQSAFWVKIKVISPVTPTATNTPAPTGSFNLAFYGPSAIWSNASNTLPWGDPDDDTPGVATAVENYTLEDKRTYSRVLVTFPQQISDGMIQGIYPIYTVQSGDRFKALIGLRQNCTDGKVRFQLKYREGSTDYVIGEWLEACEGLLTPVDLDLSPLVGKTVQFILRVTTEGEFKNDFAAWVNPRIDK